jgi:hypothetical protein
LERALVENPGENSVRKVFSNVPDESKAFFAAYQHELDHLRRIHGTTFGLLYRLLSDRVIHHFRFVCRAIEDDQVAFDFPFEFLGPGPELKRDPKIDYDSLINRLEGLSGLPMVGFWSTSIQECLAGLRNGFRTKPQFFCGQAVLKQIFRESFKAMSPEEAGAEFGLVRQGYPAVTTEELIEACAIIQETHWIGLVAASSSELDYAASVSKTYLKVIHLWSAYFDNQPDTTSSSIRGDRGESIVHSVLPVEFYALLFVSLMPPFEPGGLCTDRIWTIKDLDPGYRFSFGAECLKRSNIRHTKISDPEADQRFSEAVEILCSQMHWPEPKDLALRWTSCKEDEFFLHMVGQQEDDGWAICKQLMAEAIENPLSVAMGLVRNSPRARFSMWVCREEDGYEPRPPTGMKSDYIWSRFYLLNVSHDAMFDTRAIASLKSARRMESVKFSVSEVLGNSSKKVEKMILEAFAGVSAFP